MFKVNLTSNGTNQRTASPNKVCGLDIDAVSVLTSWFLGPYYDYVGECVCFRGNTEAFRGNGISSLQVMFKLFMKKICVERKIK